MDTDSSGASTASPKRKPGNLDLELLKAIIQKIKAGNKDIRVEEIRRLLSFEGLIMHYKSREHILLEAELKCITTEMLIRSAKE